MCEPRHSERDVDGARRRGIILQERHAAESREPTVTIRGADSRQDQLPPRVKHVSLLQEQLRVHENAVRPSPSRSARGTLSSHSAISSAPGSSASPARCRASTRKSAPCSNSLTYLLSPTR